MNNNRYVIAVFSVRTSTMQFNAILARNRIKSLIIESVILGNKVFSYI